MAIFTRFGSEVEVIGWIEDTEGEWLSVRYKDDGREREYHISEFKADGGLTEIQEAINALPEN